MNNLVTKFICFCVACFCVVDTADAYEFMITTTPLEDTQFIFYLSATGKFTVDCGEGGVLSGNGVEGNTITRLNSNEEDSYTCTYETEGVKHITFDGVATDYGERVSTVRFSPPYNGYCEVAEISGSFKNIFPAYANEAGRQPRFIETFRGCSEIKSIPRDFFGRIGGYGAWKMFYGTFEYTGITSIPPDLFSGFVGVADDMFSFTFYGCSNLAGYIPSTTFEGLISHEHPGGIKTWRETFEGTQLLKECPEGTEQYITGYERLWYGRVSCVKYATRNKIMRPFESSIGGGFNFDSIDNILAEHFNPDKDSHWKDDQGNFNTSRLISDSVAGVVLGTVGGIVTSKIIKKNQLKSGLQDLKCTIAGQDVANMGDEFQVMVQ